MTSLAFTDSPIVENSTFVNPAGAASTTPALLFVGQASGIVVATVRPPNIITQAITTYTLYRATAPTGPWTAIESRAPSPLSRWVNLFDAAPLYDTRAYYTATVDGPQQSNALYFVAHTTRTPIAPGGTLSAGAFGQYPVLGSDVFLNPISGEAMIGPNGDMLAVNGLELLAQDLRTRFTTVQGELLLHPQFGLTRERFIGAGQSNPRAQAQALQSRFIDAIAAEPRVSSLRSMTISSIAWDTWLIDLAVVAIGSEDAQRLNIVLPYFNQ